MPSHVQQVLANAGLNVGVTFFALGLVVLCGCIALVVAGILAWKDKTTDWEQIVAEDEELAWQMMQDADGQ